MELFDQETDHIMTNQLPALDIFTDDPFEAGLRHGQVFSRNVHHNLEAYLTRFEAGDMDRKTAVKLATEWGEFIRDDTPEYAAEMSGIAKGAGLPYEAIAVLNARYELTYGVISAEARIAQGSKGLDVDGCTAYGLLPEATTNGHTVIGQNWDWLAQLLGNTLIMRVHRKNAPDFVGFTEAGIAGCKMGVNEYGIGLCVNGLVTPEDGRNKHHRPLHVRCRQVLDSERFDQAIGAVIEGKRTCSSNILLGHADGEIINIEATPNHCAYLYPQDGIVTHANHLEAETRVVSLFEQVAPHTLYRGKRLERLLREKRGGIDLAVIADALSDSFGHPSAICRHPDPLLPEAKRVSTITSTALDLPTRTIHASAGPVSANPFVKFALHDT